MDGCQNETLTTVNLANMIVKCYVSLNNNNNKCVYSLKLQLVTFINENMSKNECMLRTNIVTVSTC